MKLITKKTTVLFYLLVICVPMILYSCAEKSEDSKSESSAEYTITGRVVDGPVKGATIFADVIPNSKWDDTEPKITTDKNGYYTLESNTDIPQRTKLIAQGGIDTVTNEALTNNVWISQVPKAEDGSKDKSVHVSPLSTLFASIDDNAKTDEENKDEITKMLKTLGLDIDAEDVYKKDFYKLATDGKTEGVKTMAKKVKKNNQMLATMYKTTAEIMSDEDAVVANEKYAKMMVDVSKKIGVKMKDKDVGFNLFASANVKEVITQTFTEKTNEYGDRSSKIDFMCDYSDTVINAQKSSEDGEISVEIRNSHIKKKKESKNKVALSSWMIGEWCNESNKICLTFSLDGLRNNEMGYNEMGKMPFVGLEKTGTVNEWIIKVPPYGPGGVRITKIDENTVTIKLGNAEVESFDKNVE